MTPSWAGLLRGKRTIGNHVFGYIDWSSNPTYLLDQQVTALEEQFISEGGHSEKLATERLKERQKQKSSDPVPPYPKCSKPMVLRTARQGSNAGNQFWGRFAYPECIGVAEV